MDRAGRALGLSSSVFKTHGTHNAPFFLTGICAFPIRENTVVLNVECGELNVWRRCFRGFKVSWKCFPKYIRRIFNAPIDSLPL